MQSFDSLDPRDGSRIATLPIHTAEDVHSRANAANLAAPLWQALGYDGREEVLRKWAKYITSQSDELAQLVSRETGKPLSDASLEVALAIEQLSWAAKNAKKVLSDSKRASGLLMFNMKSKVQRVPFGAVGVIGPWNYPVFTPMGSIAYALAAGNTVIFKPSEFTPAVGVWLGDSFSRITPFPHVFTVVTGMGETGEALTTSSVGKISFTGSTRTAKKVAATCATSMKPAVLECGGKDPVLVDHDANIKLAAEYALWSAMANAGQSCIGAERVYVHEKVRQQFVDEIRRQVSAIHEGKSYGPATMPSQLSVIQRHITDAATRGSTFLTGGVDAVGDKYVKPTIMLDVPEDSVAMTDETFGPTLAINSVENMDEAIALSNSSSYGLAAAVFSKKNGERIANQLHCGMVSINSVFSFAAVPTTPFGGVKDSGYGRIHGFEGLLEFTYPRTVVSSQFNLPIHFTSFKRNALADKVIKTLIKLKTR